MEGRAPSCEANAINATGCNSINNNGKEKWVNKGRLVNLKWVELEMLRISSISWLNAINNIDQSLLITNL